MTDREKVVVGNLLRAIEAERVEAAPYKFKLGEMEAAQEEHAKLRAEARKRLDLAIAAVVSLIEG